MATLRRVFFPSAAFLFCLWAFVPQVFADIHAAASCSYSDVNSAISAALEGDTVTVPPGSCTWSSELAITKGITLQGAGAGRTVITGAVGPNTHMISYIPAHPENNAAFILTGFTLDANSNSLSLLIFNGDVAHPITKVRVHHNSFLNCVYEAASSPTDVGFHISGTGVWGVFDSNTITGEWVVHTDGGSAGRIEWNNSNTANFTPGSGNNFYFEDNNITAKPAAVNSSGSPTTGCGWGGRYAVRYNTFNYVNGTGLSPWFDEHGNQASGVYACMGVEIYGNRLLTTNFADANGITAFSLRGGESYVFYNNMRTTGTSGRIGIMGFALMEENADNISPTNYSCSGSEGSSCSSNGETQHIGNSYYWNNRGDNYQGNSQPITPSLIIDCSTGMGGFGPDANCQYNGSGQPALLPNVQYWYQGSSLNGTSGVGCGTLASRPSTCTTGVGYWATNQSCSTVDDAQTGTNPTTPISGTLYKCTATNTWAAYYTPYTYPHPLRGSGNLAAPQNLRVAP